MYQIMEFVEYATWDHFYLVSFNLEFVFIVEKLEKNSIYMGK